MLDEPKWAASAQNGVHDANFSSAIDVWFGKRDHFRMGDIWNAVKIRYSSDQLISMGTEVLLFACNLKFSYQCWRVIKHKF